MFLAITCYTCQNAASESECRSTGKKILCRDGEVCQSEVRQIETNKVNNKIIEPLKTIIGFMLDHFLSPCFSYSIIVFYLVA